MVGAADDEKTIDKGTRLEAIRYIVLRLRVPRMELPVVIVPKSRPLYRKRGDA